MPSTAHNPLTPKPPNHQPQKRPPSRPNDSKSCAITTAKRLAQFLGDERVKDKGLNCTYVIAARPEAAPTSERAVPVSIFSAEPAVARAWLRKWCGDVGNGER